MVLIINELSCAPVTSYLYVIETGHFDVTGVHLFHFRENVYKSNKVKLFPVLRYCNSLKKSSKM